MGRPTVRRNQLEELDAFRWRIPRFGPMLSDGRIYASAELLEPLIHDGTLDQIVAGATLEGLAGPALAMPDAHLGYGLCIGGVVATRADDGVISPGAVGYDINCGVRLLSSNLQREEVVEKRERLADRLYSRVPCGVGGSGETRVEKADWEKVLHQGARWAVEAGFGIESDLDHCESGGTLKQADASCISDKARTRGQIQLGTLGSGNHFLEVQYVETIFDEAAATAMGLAVNQVVVMVHCGSRGLGHQVCTDFLKRLQISKQDRRRERGDRPAHRELAAAHLHSKIGAQYWKAMCAAANFAWANRQMITHSVRLAFEEVFDRSAQELGLKLVYDVSHNLAKMEDHVIEDVPVRVCVHRKGATRAFPAGHPELPDAYRKVGQPVLIPGDMGRASYVLVGSEGAMRESYGSCCHGAGRVLSRSAALRKFRDRNVHRELLEAGVLARAKGKRTLDEEAPEAYKDVEEVVRVVVGADLARRVARLRPIAVIKG